MNAKLSMLVGVGLVMAFGAAAQDRLDLSPASWPAPPYWLPSGGNSAGGTPAAEGAEVAGEPAVVRALPLVAIAPCRLLDTRAAGLPALLPGVGQEIAVVGRCGIPAQAQGLSLRLVVGEGSGGGVVSLGVAGEGGGPGGRLVLDRAQASVTTGVVGLDASGRLVAVAEAGVEHLVVEVNGYYQAEPAVRSLNALGGDVTLKAGENIAITSEGSTVTIALAPGGSPEVQRPGEAEPPVPASPAEGRRVMKVLPSRPVKAQAAVAAMVPPPSSMYVAGAIELPNTTAVGAGVLTLGGYPFLHNYGPASDAGNTFVGQQAGNFTMGGVNSWEGTHNTASGYQSLSSNTTGYVNTANGFNSLFSNTEGYGNTSSGAYTLSSNTTGFDNTASGYMSLSSNATGFSNTANGWGSLYSNTTASRNTAVGFGALYTQSFDNEGTAWESLNTAIGYQALFSNQPTTASNGIDNTAVGSQSLYSNTTGNNNAATGLVSLYSNTTGSDNTAIGYQSLYGNTTGSFNIGIGYGGGSLLTTGSSNIDIGHYGVAGESKNHKDREFSNQTRTFIAGIRGVTTDVTDAIPVLIDSAGQLGTVSSSIRFKQDVADMREASSRLMNLRPVTFHYKVHADGPLQYGLIAEEVNEVMPELVVKDATGQPETVAYHELPAMLLNELQKLHATIHTQQAQIKGQQAQIEELRRIVQMLMDDRIAAKGREIRGN